MMLKNNYLELKANRVIKLKKFKKIMDNPVLTFAIVVIICGIIEYSTSWYLEYTQGLRWWDYTGNFLNLNGRICFEGLTFLE